MGLLIICSQRALTVSSIFLKVLWKTPYNKSIVTGTGVGLFTIQGENDRPSLLDQSSIQPEKQELLWLFSENWKVLLQANWNKSYCAELSII